MRLERFLCHRLVFMRESHPVRGAARQHAPNCLACRGNVMALVPNILYVRTLYFEIVLTRSEDGAHFWCPFKYSIPLLKISIESFAIPIITLQAAHNSPRLHFSQLLKSGQHEWLWSIFGVCSKTFPQTAQWLSCSRTLESNHSCAMPCLRLRTR